VIVGDTWVAAPPVFGHRTWRHGIGSGGARARGQRSREDGAGRSSIARPGGRQELEREADGATEYNISDSDYRSSSFEQAITDLLNHISDSSSLAPG
jgi:hypothetical protein